jgi:hypothetical protein
MSGLDPRFIQLVSDELFRLELSVYRDRSSHLHKLSTASHELHSSMATFHKAVSRAFTRHVDCSNRSYHYLGCEIRALQSRIEQLSGFDFPTDLENDDW